MDVVLLAPLRRGLGSGRIDRMGWACACVASLCVLAACSRWMQGTLPLGYDASSHIPTIAALAHRLATGTGWWTDDYNLGFPLALYYQPLPHLAAALFTLIAGGGPEAAALAYRTLSVAALALTPFTAWYGARRAGAGRTTAAALALLVPWVGTSWDYGFTADSLLRVGLFTQAWGQALFPIALGELVACVAGRGRALRASIACALLAGSHLFFAVALVPVVAALLLREGVRHARSVRRPTPISPVPGLASRWLVLGCVSVATTSLLAWWLVPLVATRAWIGGFPFGQPIQRDGPGARIVLRELLTGAALDGRGTRLWIQLVGDGGLGVLSWYDHLPSLTLLCGLGAVVSLARRVTAGPVDPFASVAWITSAIGCLGLAGRTSLGRWIDLYPLHGSVELFRYSAVAQYGLLLFAAIGLGFLATAAGTRFGRRALVPVLLAGALVPAARGFAEMRRSCQLLEDAPALSFRGWTEASDALRALPPRGRVLVGPMTGLRGHYHGGLLAPWSGHPAGLSYGVGMHDSLHYATLRTLALDRDDAPSWLAYLGFTTVVAGSAPLPAAIEAASQPVWGERGDAYQIRALDAPACGTLLRSGPSLALAPREARGIVAHWLDAPFPADHRVPRLDVPRPTDGRYLAASPSDAPAPAWITDPAEPLASPGAVTCLTGGVDVRRVEVQAYEPALLVFPVSHHPFWRVWIDGEPAAAQIAFPGLLAVEVPPSERPTRVEAQFERPRRYVWLGLLAPLGLLLAGLLDRRVRQQSSRE